MTNLLIKKAATLAQKFHAGQTYGKEDYFQHHVIGVAREVANHIRPGVDRDHAKMAALLHDVLEDCPDCSASLLAHEDIPFEVIEAVVLVTKEEGYDEAEYFARIRANPLALSVKLADMHFNFSSTIRERHVKRTAKYARQIQLLIGDF